MEMHSAAVGRITYDLENPLIDEATISSSFNVRKPLWASPKNFKAMRSGSQSLVRFRLNGYTLLMIPNRDERTTH